MTMRIVTPQDAKLISQYYLENTSHLAPWEPKRPLGYHNQSNWTERLKNRVLEQETRNAFHFISIGDELDKIIAVCSLTGITYGPFMAAFMGFSVSQQQQGKGQMKKLCNHVIDFAFNQLGLNRIMANFMPENTRSKKLLFSLKFEKEGFAKKYLFINGKWQDHTLTALLNNHI